MRVLRSISDLTGVPGPVHLAIGVFDGVHLGHQAVIRAAMAQPDGTAVVVTFHPHPARLLRPARAPLLLTSTAHKVRILERLGVRHVLVLPFDAALAAMPAETFVEGLRGACQPLGSIAVGDDWTFGHRALGTVGLLRSMGVTVHAVSAIQVDGGPARSTQVREALAVGDLARAARLLGRPPTVLGTVVAGRRLGRTLGFPTANLALEDEQLPPNGVYAVRATLGSSPTNKPHEAPGPRVLSGVANLGVRPSVESGRSERRLEVHLFDFDEDLYGKELEIEWGSFIRPEQAFASLEGLTAQIARDVSAARDRLTAG